VPVGRVPALVRDDAGDDVELEPVVRLGLLDERARLGDPSQQREGGYAGLPTVPLALEAAFDDERPVLLDSLVGVPARPHDGQTNGVEVESSSPEQTEEVGARLAEGLAPGDVVTVSGELGTGKTTLVRGACRALGVEGPVTSPTYTIGHRYAGRMPVSHLDLFRFAGVSAAEWGDLEPYFLDAVCFVEWPEAGEGVLPAPRLRVALSHAGKHRRRVTVTKC
jgi:tRNA threonylcarbamoyladenosine biosynthesis protein TsaE